MTPLCLKGLIDPIVNTRLLGGPEGVNGFPSGHLDLDGGHPSLLKNILGGVLVIKMLLASFELEKVENETSKNVKRLSSVGKTTRVVALNVEGFVLSFQN
jgi:hypothetical protein